MDWKKIKSEYITDESSSYRRLAQKYDVSKTTLEQRAKREGWAEKKRQHQAKCVAKSLEVSEEKAARNAERFRSLTERLLDKLEQAIDELDLTINTNTEKVKEIEYKNDKRPDKPTKETVKETVTIVTSKTIIDRAGLKAISGAMKDIAIIQGFKSEADIREQEARIKSLEKQAEKSDDSTSDIVIRIEGADEEWAN